MESKNPIEGTIVRLNGPFPYFIITCIVKYILFHWKILINLLINSLKLSQGVETFYMATVVHYKKTIISSYLEQILC